MSEPKIPGNSGRRGGKGSVKASQPVAASTIPAARPPIAPAIISKPPVAQPAAMTAIAEVMTAAAAPVAAPVIEHPVAAPDSEAQAVAVASEPSAAPEIPEVSVSTPPVPVAAYSSASANKEGPFDMATTFDSVTTPAAAGQKVQAMFGGLNDRAKTAMEKSAKIGDELTELTKGNVEALVASSKVAAKGAESMTQEAAEFGKKNFESAAAMFKSFAAVKSPTELFQLQSDYAKSSFDSAVAEASKLSEAWVKLAGEIVQPISNRYAVAAEKLKAAAL